MERVIVTLIHGTHARKAPWTQKGSNLREAVVKAFYPSSVQFEPLTRPEATRSKRVAPRRRNCARRSLPDRFPLVTRGTS